MSSETKNAQKKELELKESSSTDSQQYVELQDEENHGNDDTVPLVVSKDNNNAKPTAVFDKLSGDKHDVKDAAFWLFMLFLASVTMTVGNKYVMQQWPYANTLTLMQNGTAVLYLAWGNYSGFLEMKPFAMKQWQIFGVCSFFLAMQILTSLKALPYVAIATLVAFRNTCTVAIAVIDYFFFGNKFSQAQIASLAVTTVGMILYALQDVNFNLVGYMWLFGNSLATIFNTFWNKIYITHYTKELKIQTSYGVSFIQQIETLPIVGFLAIVNKEGESFGEMGPLTGWAKAAIFATCLGGVLIGIAYPKCFSLVSGTSVVVASTANKAVSILIGMWLFGTRLSFMQVFGLLVCIGGSLWYAVEGKRGK
ncbi:Solute carrier family 35 (UDP-glucuronic acid UDP-N-acetylgalactosamine dual transporter), member D1 [Seminavis robusta]|uniref:Solute carrier family 35 (UDP-glucuronic acid UDP-N-acetylgalactosamine dual transporter), member D1 n=1 Tax=Seminavis robusta TaxID=568900 RepID=A0A9N8EMA9_9STRA|nr:Solute carrier family 35 (UDP-glucuronic acid UDP-N-acetylgalactosamine dual transporter), member D1 [Seminavis robusta]|eukprot:Sro1402_g269560.1 Solute carrier family 35 (UDP-glucuronic acid UDP-N-acetylgalactosamine dual transporter), member D1 (366) ;mRNA; r:13173-14270